MSIAANLIASETRKPTSLNRGHSVIFYAFDRSDSCVSLGYFVNFVFTDFFSHYRFSAISISYHRCVNHCWLNDDPVIINTLPEKKTKKF